MLDFGIYHGMGRGLTLDLVPADGVEHRELAVHIHEDVFAVVEFCVVKSWPKYRSGGRFGLSKIPASDWLGIISDLRLLKTSLIAAPDVSHMGEFCKFLESVGAAALLTELEVDFAESKRRVVGFINELLPFLTDWSAKYRSINIGGI